jgi:7-cyano-7-deazaguanine synthase
MKIPIRRGHSSKSTKVRIVVLLSGGIDSAATLAVYHKKKAVIDAVFVDYGQPSRRSEWESAQSIAEHYQIPLKKIRLGFRPKNTDGEVFCRNALMAMAAGAIIDVRPLVIAMGIHSASPYYDTTETFVGDLQRLFDGYTGGAIALGIPFLDLTKSEIVKFARRHRVPISLTYSCERRSAPPCGNCLSCMDRMALNVE